MAPQNNVVNKGMEVTDAIRGSLSGLFNNIAEFIPTLLGALVILLVGWIIAKMVKWAVLKVLRAVKFDTWIEKTGIDEYLAKGGITNKISSLLATLVYWCIMLTVLLLFFNNLGLEAVSDLISQVVAYLPKILVGIILLVVGVALANFVQSLVVTPLRNMNFKGADLAGTVAKGFILFTVISMVLAQLGIGGDIVSNLFNTFITALLGGAGLGFAIAFGWGGKDWAADVINKYLRNKI